MITIRSHGERGVTRTKINIEAETEAEFLLFNLAAKI